MPQWAARVQGVAAMHRALPPWLTRVQAPRHALPHALLFQTKRPSCSALILSPSRRPSLRPRACSRARARPPWPSRPSSLAPLFLLLQPSCVASVNAYGSATDSPSPRPSRDHRVLAVDEVAAAGNAGLARLCCGAAAGCSRPRSGPGAATAVHGQAPARPSVAADALPAGRVGRWPATERALRPSVCWRRRWTSRGNKGKGRGFCED